MTDTKHRTTSLRQQSYLYHQPGAAVTDTQVTSVKAVKIYECITLLLSVVHATALSICLSV